MRIQTACSCTIQLMACSDPMKEMWMDDLPAVLWADRITVRHTTGYSSSHRMFAQDVVLRIEPGNITWTMTNRTQAIDNRVSLEATIARRLEQL